MPSAASLIRWIARSRSIVRSASARATLLAHPLGPLLLGAPALAQVLHLDDDRVGHARRRAGRARSCSWHGIDLAVAREISRASSSHRACRRPPSGARAVTARRVVGLARASRAAGRAGRRAGRPSSGGERPVDLGDAAVEVQPRHADRRVVERRAQQRLAARRGARLGVELEEDADLGAQDGRVVRLEDVVDGAGRVAAEDVVALLADRGHEDDRHRARALAALDQLGGLEAVHARHLHVEQHDGEVLAAAAPSAPPRPSVTDTCAARQRLSTARSATRFSGRSSTSRTAGWSGISAAPVAGQARRAARRSRPAAATACGSAAAHRGGRHRRALGRGRVLHDRDAAAARAPRPARPRRRRWCR